MLHTSQFSLTIRVQPPALASWLETGLGVPAALVRPEGLMPYPTERVHNTIKEVRGCLVDVVVTHSFAEDSYPSPVSAVASQAAVFRAIQIWRV